MNLDRWTTLWGGRLPLRLDLPLAAASWLLCLSLETGNKGILRGLSPPSSLTPVVTPADPIPLHCLTRVPLCPSRAQASSTWAPTRGPTSPGRFTLEVPAPTSPFLPCLHRHPTKNPCPRVPSLPTRQEGL